MQILKVAVAPNTLCALVFVCVCECASNRWVVTTNAFPTKCNKYTSITWKVHSTCAHIHIYITICVTLLYATLRQVFGQHTFICAALDSHLHGCVYECTFFAFVSAKERYLKGILYKQIHISHFICIFVSVCECVWRQSQSITHWKHFAKNRWLCQRIDALTHTPTHTYKATCICASWALKYRYYRRTCLTYFPMHLKIQKRTFVEG